MLEEVFPHEVVIALRVGGRQSHVFVEVEGDDFGEVELTAAVAFDEAAVEAQRGASGGKAQHAVGFATDERGDELVGAFAQRLVIREDLDQHGLTSRLADGRSINLRGKARKGKRRRYWKRSQNAAMTRGWAITVVPGCANHGLSTHCAWHRCLGREVDWLVAQNGQLRGVFLKGWPVSFPEQNAGVASTS